MTVSDAELGAAVDEAAASDGLLLCPETGATLAACEKALAAGLIERSDRVVLFNCASGLKYPLPDRSKSIDRHAPLIHAQL